MVAAAVAEEDGGVARAEAGEQVLGGNGERGVHVQVVAKEAAQLGAGDGGIGPRIDGFERHHEIVAGGAQAAARVVELGTRAGAAVEGPLQERLEALAALAQVGGGGAGGRRSGAAA